MSKMTDSELEGLVAEQIDDAVSWNNTDLAQDRNDALRSYYGSPYAHNKDLPQNHSRVVTQDVLEVVEWVMPSLLRIFTSGDRVVKFNAIGPEDEAAAKQETEAVNYVWSQQNEGFMNFYTAFKDAVLQKLGVFKIEWSEGDERAVEEYEHLTEDELMRLMSRGDLELVEVEVEKPEDEIGEGEPAPAVDMTTGLPVRRLSVKVRPKKQGRIVVDVIPPEDFLISRNARSVDAADFKAWRREITVSEARRMGYDVPDDLGRSDTESTYDIERMTRFNDEGGIDSDAAPLKGAMRKLWLVVSYINADFDGDGIAELRRVVTIEKKLFENEEVAEHPFAELCPIPVPHKAIGMSLADLVMDLQLIKTTLVRQMLNNLYFTNMPRTAVQADALLSIDEMLEYRPAGIVRTNAPPANVLMPLTVPFIAKDVLPVLEMFEEMKAARSGVTKYNQGLDADTLNPTATGVDKIMNAAMSRVEMIARIFAETGVRKAFLKVHRLLRSHVESGQTLSMKLSNNWVQVNPREWRDRTDMTVSVGLGTGDKQQTLAQLMSIAGLQEKIVALQGGAQGPIVTLPNIYETCSQIVENAGLKSPSFFTDPVDPQTGQMREMPPPPPDPMAAQAQAALAIEQAKLAQQERKVQADIELARFKAEQDAALAWWRAEQEFALKGLKVQADQNARMAGAAMRMQGMPQ